MLWKLWRYGLIRRLHQRWELYRWQANGRTGTPPAGFKQRVVREVAEAHSLRVLVETGTLLGDMIFANRRSFDQIFSIELDQDLYDRACRRFRKMPHIKVIPGDSAQMLSFLQPQIAGRPCLFWLDAHWMEGGVQGQDITPILQELEQIIGHTSPESVILIDDARLFWPGTGYPTLDELQNFVAARQPSASFTVKRDIIRIVPS